MPDFNESFTAFFSIWAFLLFATPIVIVIVLIFKILLDTISYQARNHHASSARESETD